MRIFTVIFFLPLNIYANVVLNINRGYPGNLPPEQKTIIKLIKSGEFFKEDNLRLKKEKIGYGLARLNKLIDCIGYKLNESAYIALPQTRVSKEWKGEKVTKLVGKITDAIQIFRKQLLFEMNKNDRHKFNASLGTLVYKFGRRMIQDATKYYKLDSYQKSCLANCMSSKLIEWDLGVDELTMCYRTIEEAIEYGKGVCWDQAALATNFLKYTGVTTKLAHHPFHTFYRFRNEKGEWFYMDPYVQQKHFNHLKAACFMVHTRKNSDIYLIHPEQMICKNHNLSPDGKICIGDLYKRSLYGDPREIIVTSFDGDKVGFSVLKGKDKDPNPYGSEKEEVNLKDFFPMAKMEKTHDKRRPKNL